MKLICLLLITVACFAFDSTGYSDIDKTNRKVVDAINYVVPAVLQKGVNKGVLQGGSYFPSEIKQTKISDVDNKKFFFEIDIQSLDRNFKISLQAKVNTATGGFSYFYRWGSEIDRDRTNPFVWNPYTLEGEVSCPVRNWDPNVTLIDANSYFDESYSRSKMLPEDTWQDDPEAKATLDWVIEYLGEEIDIFDGRELQPLVIKFDGRDVITWVFRFVYKIGQSSYFYEFNYFNQPCSGQKVAYMNSGNWW